MYIKKLTIKNFRNFGDPPFEMTLQDLGVIFQVELMKSFPEEKVTIKAVDYRPTYVDRYLENGKPHYQVTLLNQAKPGTEEGTPVPKKFYADVTAHLESLMATPLAPGA